MDMEKIMRTLWKRSLPRTEEIKKSLPHAFFVHCCYRRLFCGLGHREIRADMYEGAILHVKDGEADYGWDTSAWS